MAPINPPITRRSVLTGIAAAPLLTAASCREQSSTLGVDVAGILPDLSFTLTRVRDGRQVSDADYTGQVVALFFGYTHCPGICPMTLQNLSRVADQLGPRAQDLSILFVTVDPRRDTPTALANYVGGFTDRADGLRGGDNQLAAITRRYRVTYDVDPEAPGGYRVTHGQSVYLFAPDGTAQLLLPRFSSSDADIDGAVKEINRLIRA
ncbi:SCO family protein [Rhodovibrio salinarum]|uniref:SCO family protein n=1 Tax=Rhodovibrio salinarum TaxID=1087 RepID=A0A934V137_9PROT|nr:SCO family protein [Rhodovibrio salinarum]MBK1697769.1 SCO family protein [Rhodovibrio salinarum]